MSCPTNGHETRIAPRFAVFATATVGAKRTSTGRSAPRNPKNTSNPLIFLRKMAPFRCFAGQVDMLFHASMKSISIWPLCHRCSTIRPFRERGRGKCKVNVRHGKGWRKVGQLSWRCKKKFREMKKEWKSIWILLKPMIWRNAMEILRQFPM